MTDIGSNQCEHGALARQCPICERDERIAELEARLEAVRGHVLNWATRAETLFEDGINELATDHILRIKGEVDPAAPGAILDTPAKEDQ